MPVTRHSYPSFTLTGSEQVEVVRRGQEVVVKGRIQHPPTEGVFTIKANIQPLKYTDLQQLPESDRTKEWIKIFTADQIRTMREGDGGHNADIVRWDNYEYEVMKCKRYRMGVLDHYVALAARLPLSAMNSPDRYHDGTYDYDSEISYGGSGVVGDTT